MSAPTKQFQNNKADFRSTVRHTMNMVTGKNVSSYTLLFMDATSKNPAGSHETIFNPSIILGRGGNCQIKYDDRYNTVSREHACIAVDGNNFMLFHNPDAKNPTIVNGEPIGDSYELQNGDEIKLSFDGPRMRFNTSNLKPSSMGLTSRLGVAMSQATRPFRRAITILSILLIAALVFAGYNLYKNIKLDKSSEVTNQRLIELQSTNASLTNQISTLESDGAASTDEIESLKKQLAKNNEKIKKIEGQTNLNRTLLNENKTAARKNDLEKAKKVSDQAKVSFDNLPKKDIYYIYATKLEFTIDGELQVLDARENNLWNKGGNVWGGTGFLTVGGKFITARRVLQPWRFPNAMWQQLSAIEAKGASISVVFEAISKTGNKFNFTTKNAVFDDSKDEFVSSDLELENGEIVSISKKQKTDDASDWAIVFVGDKSGTIKLYSELSESLKSDSKIYSVGIINKDASLNPNSDNLNSVVSESIIVKEGLTNGLINSVVNGFAQGNSGGPVFTYINGEFQVIGIISQGLEEGKGIIIPVANIK